MGFTIPPSVLVRADSDPNLIVIITRPVTGHGPPHMGG